MELQLRQFRMLKKPTKIRQKNWQKTDKTRQKPIFKLSEIEIPTKPDNRFSLSVAILGSRRIFYGFSLDAKLCFALKRWISEDFSIRSDELFIFSTRSEASRKMKILKKFLTSGIILWIYTWREASLRVEKMNNSSLLIEKFSRIHLFNAKRSFAFRENPIKENRREPP